MLRPRYATLILFLAATLTAGCTGSRETAMEAAEPAKASHPLAGIWDFSIDTPQGVFDGTITFVEVNDLLSGTLSPSQRPDRNAPLDELMFDSEASKVTFKLESSQYGMMLINLTLDGNAMNGMMNITPH